MERILIVDDEKNYLVVLSALLSGEGYEVVTAGNGAGALVMVEEEEPDLVITDMRMPGHERFGTDQAAKGTGGGSAHHRDDRLRHGGKRGGGHEIGGGGLHHQAL